RGTRAFFPGPRFSQGCSGRTRGCQRRAARLRAPRQWPSSLECAPAVVRPERRTRRAVTPRRLERTRPACAGGSRSCSRRALLVLPVLFPETRAQLRIRLLHRGLAKLPRNDVVILAVRNVGRNGTRAAAALDAA